MIGRLILQANNPLVRAVQGGQSDQVTEIRATDDARIELNIPTTRSYETCL